MSSLLLRFPTSIPGNATPISITTPSPLPAATSNVLWTTPLQAVGGIPPYKNWTVINGPAGMTVTQTGNTTSNLQWLPPTESVPTVFTFKISVQDQLGSQGFITNE